MSAHQDKPATSRQTEVFMSEVKKHRERREEYERDGDSSFWSVVGMTGTIGWSIMLPTAAGVLLGRWLDGRLESGNVFMMFFMLVGLAAGCIVAWRMIKEKI